MNASFKLDPTVLREYDIRGVIGETLDARDFEAIGRSFGSEIIVSRGAGSTACVGYDGRLSSPELQAAITSGLRSAGVNVITVGLGPSPMLYYATHELEADAGVMVTGSHNPPQFNGIKMTIGGASVHGSQIQEIGRRLETGHLTSGKGTLREETLDDKYVARLARDFRPGTDLRVAWDPGNGASGDIVTALTKMLPGRHIVINGNIDGTFPSHHPDPTVEATLRQLKEVVAAENCDIGIGLDGDGDRIGVIDSQGRVLWGDQILLLLAREVLSRLPGASIVADIKASRVLFDGIRQAGGTGVMWKAGHSLIKTKMAALSAPLAGEMSGHIFFADGYYGYDDALYAGVRLLSILANSAETLDDMRDALPKLHNTPEIRFDCAEDRKFEVVDEVRDRLSKLDKAEIIDIDGVRVETADGWWLLRASNTQPVLTARCESESAAGLSRLKAALRAQLEQSGVELPAALE